MDHSNLYKKTEQYVTKLFREYEHAPLSYHNLDHTKYVVSKAQEIAGHYQLNEQEMLVVFVAAWFHDTGYLVGGCEDHEEKGVDLMKTFLKKHDVSPEIIEQVEECIMATKAPRSPDGLLQQIVCDADTYNLGSKDFKESNKAVFIEMQQTNCNYATKEEFHYATIRMMESHEFYTTYAQEQLNDRKQKNMKKIKGKIEREDESVGPQITEKEGTTKGMQTMLRLTSTNHIQLSEMADNKANILISVNAIIISVILSVLLRKLATDPYLTIPTVIFLIAAVTTIIIAILATRPKVTGGTFDEDDIINKKTNLLFFGNFHRVPLEKYDRAMRTMMKDSDYLYSSIVQDIYHLGAVLGKKYKLIRLAYNVFMIGIILSVLAFAVAVYINQDPAAAEAAVNNSGGSPF